MYKQTSRSTEGKFYNITLNSNVHKIINTLWS